MKTIIAGSRSINDMRHLERALALSGIAPTVVLCGGAFGVDELGSKWAHANGVPVWGYPAEWSKYGRRAGFVRNITMAEHASALIAVWNGSSPGTKHMIREAEDRLLRVYVHIVKPVPLKLLPDWSE